MKAKDQIERKMLGWEERQKESKERWEQHAESEKRVN